LCVYNVRNTVNIDNSNNMIGDTSVGEYWRAHGETFDVESNLSAHSRLAEFIPPFSSHPLVWIFPNRTLCLSLGSYE